MDAFSNFPRYIFNLHPNHSSIPKSNLVCDIFTIQPSPLVFFTAITATTNNSAQLIPTHVFFPRWIWRGRINVKSDVHVFGKSWVRKQQQFQSVPNPITVHSNTNWNLCASCVYIYLIIVSFITSYLHPPVSRINPRWSVWNIWLGVSGPLS